MRTGQKRPCTGFQLNWVNWNRTCDLVGDMVSSDNPGRSVETFADSCGEEGPYIELTLPTLEGEVIMRHGDWFVLLDEGFIIVPFENFADNYELTDE